jgi:NAD(P)-dependent dehydrogenase (short-subunit alcohol dehydrogenase family)
MRTVVMTGGTAGFGAVAAQQIVNAPDTRLIVGARDIKASSIDTLPLDLARLASVRLFVEALGKTLGDNKIDALIMNAGAQFGTPSIEHATDSNRRSQSTTSRITCCCGC